MTDEVSAKCDDIEGLLSGLSHIAHNDFEDNYFTFIHNMLRSFCAEIEAGIEQNIETYKQTDKYVDTGIEPDPEDHTYAIFSGEEHYQGLSSCDVFNLDDIFTSYFPNMHRRSAFLTIFGVFEHELEKYCRSYGKYNKTPIKLNDLKGSGFERANRYIKKMVGVGSAQAAQIKLIQVLRNACAHQDGRIYDNEGNKIEPIARLINDFSDSLAEDDAGSIVIKPPFLESVLEIFHKYFADINQFIKDSGRK